MANKTTPNETAGVIKFAWGWTQAHVVVSERPFFAKVGCAWYFRGGDFHSVFLLTLQESAPRVPAGTAAVLAATEPNLRVSVGPEIAEFCNY